MRKTIIALILTVCILTAFVACTKTDNTDTGSTTTRATTKATEAEVVTPAGEFPIVKEKVTVRIMVPDRGGADWDTCLFTSYYEEMTNVKVVWDVAPTDGLVERKNLALTSGDYPDAFMRCNISRAEAQKYGEIGVFHALNSEIEKYGINLQQAIAGFPNSLKGITAPDGNIYGLPYFNECYHCDRAMKMWINTEWLTKLGLNMPKTTDEFYDVLTAFKTRDPNGNGDADEVPLSGSTDSWWSMPHDWILNAFVYSDGENRLLMNNGKVEAAFVKDEFKEGLAYLKKLYDEGLLDNAVFTQSYTSVHNYAAQDQIGVAPGGWQGTFTSFTPDGPWSNFEIMEPLAGPNGVKYSFYNPDLPSPGAFVITDKLKNPEILVRWADWMYSLEGTLEVAIGKQGQHWRWAEAGEKGLDGRDAVWFRGELVENIEPNTTWGISHVVFSLLQDTRLGQVVQSDGTKSYELQLYEGSKMMDAYKPSEIVQVFWMAEEQQDDYLELLVLINNHVNQSIAQFVSGVLDLNRDWDKYISELNAMGLEQYLKIVQDVMDAHSN